MTLGPMFRFLRAYGQLIKVPIRQGPSDLGAHQQNFVVPFFEG